MNATATNTTASKAATSKIGPLPFASEELSTEATASAKPKPKKAPALARSRTAPVSYSRQSSRDRIGSSPRRAKSSDREAAQQLRSPTRRATQAQGRVVQNERIPRKARRSPQRDEDKGTSEGSRSRSPIESGPRSKATRRKESFDQTRSRSPRRNNRSRSASPDGQVSDLDADELQFIRSEYRNHLRRAATVDAANSGNVATRPKRSRSPNLRRSKSADEDSHHVAFAKKGNRDHQGKGKTVVLQKAVSARSVIDRHPCERSNLRKAKSSRNVDSGRRGGMSSLQKALSAKNVVNATSQRGDHGKARSEREHVSNSPKKSSSLKKALSERSMVKTSASEGRGDMRKARSARHVVRGPSKRNLYYKARNESGAPSDTSNMSNSARSPQSPKRAPLQRSLSAGCEAGGAMSARVRLQRAASSRMGQGSSHRNILDESDSDGEPFGEAEPTRTQMNSSSHSEQRMRQMNSSSHSEHRVRSRSPRSPRCPGRPRLCTKHSGVTSAQLHQLDDHLEETKQKEEAFARKQKQYTNGLTQLVKFDTADKTKETRKAPTSKDATAGKQKAEVAIQKQVFASMQEARKADLSSSEHKGGKGRMTASIRAMSRIFGSETKPKGSGFKVSGPNLDAPSAETAPPRAPLPDALLVPFCQLESEELHDSNADLESLEFGLDVKSSHTMKLPLMT